MACMLAIRHNLLTDGCLSKKHQKSLAIIHEKKPSETRKAFFFVVMLMFYDLAI